MRATVSGNNAFNVICRSQEKAMATPKSDRKQIKAKINELNAALKQKIEGFKSAQNSVLNTPGDSPKASPQLHAAPLAAEKLSVQLGSERTPGSPFTGTLSTLRELEKELHAQAAESSSQPTAVPTPSLTHSHSRFSETTPNMTSAPRQCRKLSSVVLEGSGRSAAHE